MYISLNDKNLRVKIEKQMRLTERFSAGRKFIKVQIPSWYRKKDFEKITRKLDGWLNNIESHNPGFLNRYIIKDYRISNQLEAMGSTIEIQVEHQDRKTMSISLTNNLLSIKTPADTNPEQIRKGVIDIIKKKYRTQIKTEVETLNQNTVQGIIKNIRLKDNFSNWGSCSNSGNINLSVRLFLLPEDVRSYVIIHELCHLKELNHSKRFWSLVAEHCPTYKTHEKWLDKNGNQYYF